MTSSDTSFASRCAPQSDQEFYIRWLLATYWKTFFFLWWYRTKEIGLRGVIIFTLTLHGFVWLIEFFAFGFDGRFLASSWDIIEPTITIGVFIFFLAYPVCFIWYFVRKAFLVPVSMASLKTGFKMFLLETQDFSEDLFTLREMPRLIAQRCLMARVAQREAQAQAEG